MRSFIKKLRNEAGFTLIEMLIVIMIVSILLILVVTNIGGIEKTITNTADDGIIQTIESQKLIYKIKNNKDASPENLKDDSFITEKQLDAYNTAISNKKKPE